jgi:hypothetical protein
MAKFKQRRISPAIQEQPLRSGLPHTVAFKGAFHKHGNYALQSEENQEEVALTAASVPSLERHESPIPDKFPSLSLSLGTSHKG